MLTNIQAALNAFGRGEVMQDAIWFHLPHRMLVEEAARRMQAAIEAAMEHAWRPMNDAPKDGTPVLLSCDGHVSISRWYVHWRNGKPNPDRAPEWWQPVLWTDMGADYRGPLQPQGWMRVPKAIAVNSPAP